MATGSSPSPAPRHLGILAHTIEGAALCARTFCHAGFAELGPNDHPHLTLDCVALARSMQGPVCTEIPLLITPEVSPLPTLDSTRLLARAAFDVAVGRRPFPVWRGGPVGPA